MKDILTLIRLIPQLNYIAKKVRTTGNWKLSKNQSVFKYYRKEQPKDQKQLFDRAGTSTEIS